MTKFKTILGKEIYDIQFVENAVCISTNLSIRNIIKLFNALAAKKVYVSSIFRLYRRWTIELSNSEFNEAVANSIIK